jgi:hypothetical protein
LREDKVVFDDSGLIQICDICVHRFSEVGDNSAAIAEVGGFSGENLRPAADVRAFAKFLSKL